MTTKFTANLLIACVAAFPYHNILSCEPCFRSWLHLTSMDPSQMLEDLAEAVYVLIRKCSKSSAENFQHGKNIINCFLSMIIISRGIGACSEPDPGDSDWWNPQDGLSWTSWMPHLRPGHRGGGGQGRQGRQPLRERQHRVLATPTLVQQGGCSYETTRLVCYQNMFTFSFKISFGFTKFCKTIPSWE